MQEFQNVEEIILGVRGAFDMYRPQILLAYRKEDLQIYIASRAFNMPRIYAVKAKGLMKIAVLPQLLIDPYK